MKQNLLPSEQSAIVGVIDPDAYGAGTELSDAVDMAQFEAVLAIVTVGEMAATSTVNAKITQATTAGGTYKDITGKAITALTAAGSDDDKQALINVRAEDLDVANGYRYIKLDVTTAVAASDSAGVVVGFNGKTQPASNYDLASVDEIV